MKCESEYLYKYKYLDFNGYFNFRNIIALHNIVINNNKVYCVFQKMQYYIRIHSLVYLKTQDIITKKQNNITSS